MCAYSRHWCVPTDATNVCPLIRATGQMSTSVQEDPLMPSMPSMHQCKRIHCIISARGCPPCISGRGSSHAHHARGRAHAGSKINVPRMNSRVPGVRSHTSRIIMASSFSWSAHAGCQISAPKHDHRILTTKTHTFSIVIASSLLRITHAVMLGPDQ